MNEQTLELQIKSKAQEAKSSVDSLVKSLTNVENVLTNIYLEMGSIEKNGLKTTVTNVNQLKQTTDKATTSANKLGKALSLGGTYIGAKRLTMQMLGWMNEAVDFTEQLNLFNVVFDNVEKNGVKTFSELGKSATQFQYKLNEAFGTNKTQSLYTQAIYQSMGENQGISDYYASIMSETMTKFTYDLASLYNKSEKTTAEALRASVYAGMTKPARNYGLDVTQNSMQPILNELGIDKQVKELSQAEKMILRYIAVLKQGQVAMGDFANTCESPSNQLKIFRQQLVETKVAISSLFMGMFANILPYANAFLMVVKEVSKAIADMFGIEITDYNSSIASQEGIYDGIEESAEDASDAVKELKRQVLGFDEIHNISENTDSGSSTSISGGIDQRLLDAITGYDNGMDKVRMKATEIRDRIMEWLGFTQDANGEWKFTDVTLGTIVATLAGITFPLVAFSKFLGITKSIIGAKGASSIVGAGVGASGLLGILGILSLVTAGVWTITLICKGTDVVTNSINTTQDALSNLITGSSDATKKLVELAKSGDTSSDSFNNLSNYLLNNINRNKQEIETLESMKNWFTDLTGATENYTSQQKTLNQANENTLRVMESLYKQGYITKDMYIKFAEAVDSTNKKMLDFNPTISESKNKTVNFEEECKKAKENVKGFKDELGLLSDTTPTASEKIKNLKNNLENTGQSATNSKDKIKELQETINRTTGKQITLDIDANTNRLKNKITDVLNSFGFGLGSGGFRANGGIYSNGTWHDIPQYANGGAPSHGTLFWAGENGAEVVAHANGKTEVLNQSQIASAIYSAVYSAMSQFSGQTNEIDVHVHTDEGTVVDRVNQKTKQTGVCPIYIPAQ